MSEMISTQPGYDYEIMKFDQPIGDWDVGNVINMQGMFGEAVEFN